MRLVGALLVALCFVTGVLAKPDPADCEVCKKVVEEVRGKLSEADKKDLVKVEGAFGKFCEKVKNEKESKLCYFIDPIKREISTPIKNGVPSDVICQRLKKKSAEICSLKYAASAGSTANEINAQTDFSKLRISQLKAYIAEKGINCPECLEKDDFVRKVKEHLGLKTDL